MLSLVAGRLEEPEGLRRPPWPLAVVETWQGMLMLPYPSSSDLSNFIEIEQNIIVN